MVTDSTVFIRYYVDDQIEKDEVGRLFGTYRTERRYLLKFRCRFSREDIFSKT